MTFGGVNLGFHRKGGTGTSWSSPVHLFVEHLGLSFSGAVDSTGKSCGGRLLKIAGVVSKNSSVNAPFWNTCIQNSFLISFLNRNFGGLEAASGAKKNHHLKANLEAGFIGYHSTGMSMYRTTRSIPQDPTMEVEPSKKGPRYPHQLV